MKNLLLVPLLIMLFGTHRVSGQEPTATVLEKMPQSLETDFALSALPPQLRSGATVYLLNPAEGYYVARKGSNGFICFVMRTAWEWAEFRDDIYTAISYDTEGARTIFPVYRDAAAMRASGKFTALKTRDIILSGIRSGFYKAPAHTGVSYMLAPLMRTYPKTPADHQVMTMQMPHYMFYAPYLTNKDIGNIPDGKSGWPLLVNPEAEFLGQRKAPYAYIIVPVGAKEAEKIVAEQKLLLKRLADYKPFLN